MSSNPILQLLLNEETGTVMVRGREVHLARVRFLMLKCLIANANKKCTYRMLGRVGWGRDVAKQQIFTQIYILRKEIEVDFRSPMLIVNVDGGYKYMQRAEQELVVGNLKMDFVAAKVTVDAIELNLPPTQNMLLEYLCRHHEVCPVDDLMVFTFAKRACSTYLSHEMGEIREALKSARADVELISIANRGYQLILLNVPVHAGVNVLWVDTCYRVARLGSKAIILPSAQFDLLKLLMREQGQLCADEFITAELWGIEAKVNSRKIRELAGGLQSSLESAGYKTRAVVSIREVGLKLDVVEEVKRVPLKLIRESRTVIVEGRRVVLSELYFSLLSALYDADEPIHWRKLAKMVGMPDCTRQNVSDKMERIRKKLSLPDHAIRAEPRAGYRLYKQ